MDTSNASFLLVDDNEVFLELIAGMIQRAYPAATIARATTGGAALSMLVERPYDVVLLDYRLPDLDGVEVLAELRKNSVPSAVVIVTGEGDERLAADLFRMGAYDYLVKSGIDGVTLRRCLDQVLMRLLLEGQISRKSDALVDTSRELAERTRALDVAYEKIRQKNDLLRQASDSLETQVQLRTAELQATTAFLNQVLDSTASHFIVATDAEGTILTFNAGAEALFGWSEEDVVGDRNFAALFQELGDAAERASLEEDLQRAGRALREFTGVDAHGRPFLAKVSFDPLAGEGERQGLVIVGSDVTHERELERQNEAYIEQIEQANQDLRRKNEQILEANRMKSQFIANVSHELRTPLNAIIGYSDLLTGGIYGPMPERQSSAVEGITARARDLLTLINDILDLAKIEAGAMDLRVDEFPLHDVVEAVVETARILALGKPLEVRWDDDDAGGVVLRTDRQKVQQVLMNLVNNATKFTHEGFVTVLTRRLSAGDVEIAVADSGIGIPEAEQGRVFDEFRQVDGTSTRQYGGTGLGLAISRKFARGLGGDLSLESTPGEGSTFRLRLPSVLPGSGGLVTDHLHVPVALDPTLIGDDL
jgi:PAS domain S-box-containing protein